MKISLKWLGEFFAELPAGRDPLSQGAELRAKLPHAGIEIGPWKRMGEGLEAVIVAQLVEFSKHPNADKLNVCKVATGKPGEMLQIVCGAPNVKAGAKVALAPVGCTLPGDFKIKQAAIRGVDSSGMLCSERELGLSEESQGIMLLPDSAPVGSPLVKALGLNDEVWEVELTPDRADCLSHLGMAREVGRLLSAKPKLPELEDLRPSETGDVPMFSVEVQAPKACPIYGAQLFEGYEARPAPEWMRRTLDKLGIRSHNAAVDVTNYVLMELGHPLHTFDADKLTGSKIIVRFAKNGEKLKTLDGELRTLTNEDLVIADAEKPVALAGVMGGFDSGVTETTKRILLESALFDPAVVRAMAQRHKIHSDASHRFERGVDATGCLRSAGRASLLLRQVGGARRRGAYIEHKTDKAEKLLHVHTINFNLRTFKEVLGLEVSPEDIIHALSKIGIEAFAKSTNVLRVDVPPHRLDLTREIDLVEEAARLVGYDKIEARYPGMRVRPKGFSSGLHRNLTRVRHRLLETGLTEMMPYAFISEAKAKFVPHHALVELKNPLSADWRYMRPNLAFGLLEVAARHAALGQLSGAFFDCGATFESVKGDVAPRTVGSKESWHGGWLLMGLRNREHWSTDKASSDRKAHVDFFDAKGVAESVISGLSAMDGRWGAVQYVALDEMDATLQAAVEKDASWIPLALLHPGRSALLVLPGKPPGQPVGYVGELHPEFKRNLLNLPAALQLGVALGEFRWVPDIVAALGVVGENPDDAPSPRGKIGASSRMPVVERDIALVVAADAKSGELEKAFRKKLPKQLLDVACVDRFVMPDGRLSLAWRFWYQDAEKTLTDAEVQGFMDSALGEAKRLGASLR